MKSMIRTQHVDNGKLNKCISKTNADCILLDRVIYRTTLFCLVLVFQVLNMPSKYAKFQTLGPFWVKILLRIRFYFVHHVFLKMNLQLQLWQPLLAYAGIWNLDRIFFFTNYNKKENNKIRENKIQHFSNQFFFRSCLH